MSQTETAADNQQPKPDQPDEGTPIPPSKPRPPTSPRKLASSLANGALSQGPTTPEGLATCASSPGNFRHGMLAQTVVLASESLTRFDALVEEYMAEYSPASKSERDLVEAAAVARWRMLRVQCLQKTDLDLEICRQQSAAGPTPLTPRVAATLAFRSLNDKGSTLSNANRYETTYERQYQRALRELKKNRRRTQNQLPRNPAGSRVGRLLQHLRPRRAGLKTCFFHSIPIP